jgi:hypothetical protein
MLRIACLFLVSIAVNAEAIKLTTIVGESNQPVIVIDKQLASISVYQPSVNTVVKSPVLLGKVKSDVLDMNSLKKGAKANNITPAGDFVIKKANSSQLKSPVLVFVKGQNAVIAVHPVWLGNPKQKRLDRLNSSSVDDNRITSGCVNILADYFYSVLNLVPNNTRLVVLSENDYLVDDVTFSFSMN